MCYITIYWFYFVNRSDAYTRYEDILIFNLLNGHTSSSKMKEVIYWNAQILGMQCGIMLVLRAVFNMLVRNASPLGPMCFRCLMLNLSGPCE